MKKHPLNSNGFGAIELLLVFVVLVVVAGGGAYLYHKDHKAKTPVSTSKTSTTSTSTKTATADLYAGWKTYTSSEEKASFKYPSNWTIDPQGQYVSNDSSNKDYLAIMSPDGKVTVRWTSLLDGLGNESGDSYPLNTIISKSALANASGDYVVSGITTLDGTTYYPWIAVENDPTYGVLSTGVGGDLDLFMGRNNVNTTTGNHDTALFSTSGPKTNEGAPALSKSQAITYLSDSDMQQAQKILQSLSY